MTTRVKTHKQTSTVCDKDDLAKKLKYRLPQIRLVLVRERTTRTIAIRVPSDLERYVEPLRHLSEENFVAYHLDAKHHILGYHVVSQGTVSSSLVHPREVFKAALLSNAFAIIVAHNHPAGSLTPSEEDRQVTEQLVKGGNLLGVQVIDHLIVSHRGLQSMREINPELF